MKTFEVTNHIEARAKIKVIGIAEDDLCPKALRSSGTKDLTDPMVPTGQILGFNNAMGQLHLPEASPTVSLVDFEHSLNLPL